MSLQSEKALFRITLLFLELKADCTDEEDMLALCDMFVARGVKSVIDMKGLRRADEFLRGHLALLSNKAIPGRPS